MIKVFENKKEIYSNAYKNCDIIGILRPHRDFWWGAYVRENFIEGFDIIYVAHTLKGYIAFPKEMPEIWQIMIEEKANEYANNHFAYLTMTTKGLPACHVTYNNYSFGAGAIQSFVVRERISNILQSDDFYILILNEDHLTCIPATVQGTNKNEIAKFINALVNKTADEMLVPKAYYYNKAKDKIE